MNAQRTGNSLSILLMLTSNYYSIIIKLRDNAETQDASDCHRHTEILLAAFGFAWHAGEA